MNQTSINVDEIMVLLGRNQVEIYALQKENAQLKAKLEQVNKASAPTPIPVPPVAPTS